MISYEIRRLLFLLFLFRRVYPVRYILFAATIPPRGLETYPPPISRRVSIFLKQTGNPFAVTEPGIEGKSDRGIELSFHGDKKSRRWLGTRASWWTLTSDNRLYKVGVQSNHYRARYLRTWSLERAAPDHEEEHEERT